MLGLDHERLIYRFAGRDSPRHMGATQNVLNDAHTCSRQVVSADKELEMATYLLLIPISASVLSESVRELREKHSRELRVYCELWDGTSVEGTFSNNDRILHLHSAQPEHNGTVISYDGHVSKPIVVWFSLFAILFCWLIFPPIIVYRARVWVILALRAPQIDSTVDC